MKICGYKYLYTFVFLYIRKSIKIFVNILYFSSNLDQINPDQYIQDFHKKIYVKIDLRNVTFVSNDNQNKDYKK